MRTHELLGDNRLRFASQLGDMSDELLILGKEVEKNRKLSKDLGARLERGLAEQDAIVDKVSQKSSYLKLYEVEGIVADLTYYKLGKS